MVNRNTKCRVSHSSYFPWQQRLCDPGLSRYSSSNSVQPPLPTLDLPESENLENFSENREESQIAEPLCTNGTTPENAPDAPYAPGTRKSTRKNFGKPAKKYSDQLYL